MIRGETSGTDHGFSVLTFHSTRTGAIKPRQSVNSDVRPPEIGRAILAVLKEKPWNFLLS